MVPRRLQPEWLPPNRLPFSRKARPQDLFLQEAQAFQDASGSGAPGPLRPPCILKVMRESTPLSDLLLDPVRIPWCGADSLSHTEAKEGLAPDFNSHLWAAPRTMRSFSRPKKWALWEKVRCVAQEQPPNPPRDPSVEGRSRQASRWLGDLPLHDRGHRGHGHPDQGHGGAGRGQPHPRDPCSLLLGTWPERARGGGTDASVPAGLGVQGPEHRLRAGVGRRVREQGGAEQKSQVGCSSHLYLVASRSCRGSAG